MARPESGWEVKVAQNGPDKVEVWFWKEGRLSQVEAWSNGAWKVTEWRCYSRSRFDCETV